jgi:hypothetical protein
VACNKPVIRELFRAGAACNKAAPALSVYKVILDQTWMDPRIRGDDKAKVKSAQSAKRNIVMSFPRKASSTMLAGIQVRGLADIIGISINLNCI